MLTNLLFLFFGLCVGGLTAWLYGNAQCLRKLAQVHAELDPQLAILREKLDAQNRLLAENESDRQKKDAWLSEVKGQFVDVFKALSADALRSNNQTFLELAALSMDKLLKDGRDDLGRRQDGIAQLLAPVRETLHKFDSQMSEIEKARIGAYESLREQVKVLHETQQQLRTETASLVRALSVPKARGNWGEMQLRRVVEIAGMLPYCDFLEQVSVTTEDGRQRPDMVVRLPAGKSIVIDAKVPLTAYLEALEVADDQKRKEKLLQHARNVREQINLLSRKSYWEQFPSAPEFVVLFLPGEVFFSVALEHDPSLLEYGVEQRIILATPTTLIALLKSVSYGWRQENLAANAQQISLLGRELHKRLGDMQEHLLDLGGKLSKAVESYNKTSASFESRVLVSARKFSSLEAVGTEDNISQSTQIESVPRLLRSQA